MDQPPTCTLTLHMATLHVPCLIKPNATSAYSPPSDTQPWTSIRPPCCCCAVLRCSTVHWSVQFGRDERSLIGNALEVRRKARNIHCLGLNLNNGSSGTYCVCYKSLHLCSPHYSDRPESCLHERREHKCSNRRLCNVWTDKHEDCE